MNDNEIVKALECCVKSKTVKDCEENGCPAFRKDACYYACATESNDFIDAMLTDALDLINRQKAELEKKDKLIEIADKMVESLKAEVKRLKAEAEMLKKVTTNTINTSIEFGLDKENQINKAKSEAIKEFDRKLWKECVKTMDTDSLWWIQDIRKQTLKEMVGDDNG